jgi:predicted MPP superfamily phosphohydrolase
VLGAVAAVVVYGWFEAGWLRRRVLEIEIAGLPRDLDGVRIAHLSDLHLGPPSRGNGAVEKAVSWVAARKPDLVCVTGDLVSRRSGLQALERHLASIAPCYLVLGNHDFASTRDPFSERLREADFKLPDGATLLIDDAVEVRLRGGLVQLVGVDPLAYMRGEAGPSRLADEAADLRILLCHFPGIGKRLRPGVFDLVLAGHLHAGQIAVPFPGGKFRLAHLPARDVEGLYRYGSTWLHVSPGIGTTFVPFRFFARPEVTELVVRSKA